MKDKWHWLRHKWTKWEPYQKDYRFVEPDIRQWRVCQTCGFLQDELVDVNAVLQVYPTSEWPKLPEQTEPQN